MHQVRIYVFIVYIRFSVANGGDISVFYDLFLYVV